LQNKFSIMKTIKIIIIFSSLIACFNFCVKENIPFTYKEFSLVETQCQWMNLDYNDTVIIINSNEKFKKYINCTEGNCPEIDFSEHTLLLATGTKKYGIISIAKDLQQFSTENYKLSIKIELNDLFDTERWVIALVTDKLKETSNVELKVITNASQKKYPAEVKFEEYSLGEIECSWKYYTENKVIIINSKEQLETYICKKDALGKCISWCADYSEIDFSKHSLLFAKASTPSMVDEIRKSLLQVSENKYKLDVELKLSGNDAVGEWTVALIVNKISKESEIELIVNRFPKFLSFSNYSLEGSSCQWIPNNLSTPELIIINNYETLENYINCTVDNYPVIDFSKQTMLLVRGCTGHDVSKLKTHFFQMWNNEYYLGIGVYKAASIEETVSWYIPIIINKLNKDANIEFDFYISQY